VPSSTSFLRLLVPPLVVAAGVGAILARAASPETLRETREDSIRARWSVPAEFEALERDVEAYLAHHGDDPDARRFAAEAFARILLPRRALDVALPAGTPPDPREARRLAVLEVLGTVPGPPPRPSALYPRTTLARVDAGDPAARAALAEAAAAMGMNEIVAWFIPAYRSETAGKQAVLEALSRREDLHFRLAGAIGATGPRVTEHVPFLIEVLRMPEWREGRRPTWQQICRALGSSKTPLAIEALLAERAARTETGPDGDLRRTTLDVALAIAGDGPSRDRVLAASADPTGNGWVPLLYAGGLQMRLFQGDETAAPEIAELWRLVAPRPGTPPLEEPVVRLQLAVGMMLSDALPPTSIPVSDWALELEKHPSPLQRAIALAWRWRHRDPGALERMVEELRQGLDTAPVFVPAAYDTAGVSAVVEILRAWYRWS
jgi:hypothetical protein